MTSEIPASGTTRAEGDAAVGGADTGTGGAGVTTRGADTGTRGAGVTAGEADTGTPGAGVTAAAEAERLLRAGAVLPPGTPGGGDRAVPVFSQAYRHRGLGDRVVVRLVATEHPESLTTGFLGLRPEGGPVEVGVGRPRALGFPEWVLVHHPADGHLAMSVAEEMTSVARTVRSRPKRARAAYEALGERLAGSVPHFLPTVYEEAGRAFLAAEETSYAERMFVNARKAETAHALPFDEERMNAVFLEFALAGAVPTKVLSGYAKGLATRVPAPVAFRHVRELFVRLAAHGVAPSGPGVSDLRRLAKAAVGREARAEEVAYLREMLTLPGTAKASPAWWKANRAALLDLTRREPAARGALLGMLPAGWEQEELAQWLEILEATGAAAGLLDAALPAGVRPPDGTAGWTRRFLELCRADYLIAPPGLYPLVDRAANVLRAELTSNGEELTAPCGDVNLLDQLLALGIPVAPPKPRARLRLDSWAVLDERRDLLALRDDARFHRAFDTGCPSYAHSGGERTVRTLAESPGGRPLLASWLQRICRQYLGAGLHANQQTSGPLLPLEWLPGEVLAVAEQPVREALGTGIAPDLARSLRTGLLDELGWPAWDELIAEVGRTGDVTRTVWVMDAWPYLVVRVGRRIRVIGAEGTVLTHDAVVPDTLHEHTQDIKCHYVDGELLVWWLTYTQGNWDHWGYWHRDPSHVFRVVDDSGRLVTHPGDGPGTVSLPLPGGGRTTGNGVLRHGDTVVPPARRTIGDGTSYWVRESSTDAGRTWFAYDPTTGVLHGPGAPDWFREGLRDAPEGSSLVAAWLLPAPAVEPGPSCAPVDGLLGWRVVQLPDGSRRGEDLAGRSVVVPRRAGRSPRWAVRFPGGDGTLAVVRTPQEVHLLTADGTVAAAMSRSHTAGPFTAGTPLAPPLSYWHLLRPRDPQGSAALRAVDEGTAAALLAAAAEAGSAEAGSAEAGPSGTGAGDAGSGQARSGDAGSGARSGNAASGALSPETASAGAATAGEDRLLAEIRTLLPGVSHEALRAGVAGVVRLAAGQQRVLDAALARLDEAVAHRGREAERPAEPEPATLAAALQGLGINGQRVWSYHSSYSHTFGRAVFRLVRVFGEARRGVTAPAPAGRPHLALPDEPALHCTGWEHLPRLAPLAALRAATAGVADRHREALLALLAELETQGLAVPDPAQWRRVRLALDENALAEFEAVRSEVFGSVLPLRDGAFIAFPYADTRWREPSGPVYEAVFHDPAGRFDAPAPYTLESAEPFFTGQPRGEGWFSAFRAELAARGPAPWFPEAAEEFARLTGLTPTMARLAVAGVPLADDGAMPVPAATLKTIGVKAGDVAVARETMGCDGVPVLESGVWQTVLAALLPAEPSALWTDGPDVAAAAEVWNERMGGRRTPVPEDVLYDAARTLQFPNRWGPYEALTGFLDVTADPRLTRDKTWRPSVRFGSRAEESGPGFETRILNCSMALAAWLAHRLPAGDPLRATLPTVLKTVRERLANPRLLIDIDRRVEIEAYLRTAGEPSETAPDHVRHGAVVVPTGTEHVRPAVVPVLLDATGNDPYLESLFPGQPAEAAQVSLRLAHDPRFAELLADPGDPVAGGRDEDGRWWPQNPALSVPDLVGEVAKRYGLSEDAAVVYLMLLAMPDCTDRNTALWTGWTRQRGGTARLRAARAELAATDLVVEGSRGRAGRSLFLPGSWVALSQPLLPLERWKEPMYDLLDGTTAALGVIVPSVPAATLYRTAWQRVLNGDAPRLDEPEVPKPRRGRR